MNRRTEVLIRAAKFFHNRDLPVPVDIIAHLLDRGIDPQTLFRS